MDKFANHNYMEILLNSMDIRRCGRDLYFTGVNAQPLSDQEKVPKGAYHQTIHIFDKIKIALQGYGAQLDNLIACTIYLKTLQDTEQFGLAFNDTFGLKNIEASVLVDANIEASHLIRIDAHAYLDKAFESRIKHETNIEEIRKSSVSHKKISPIPSSLPGSVKTESQAGPLKVENQISLQDEISQKQSDYFEDHLTNSFKKLEELMHHQESLEYQKRDWFEQCRGELARHNRAKAILQSEKHEWGKKQKKIQDDILGLRKILQKETEQLNRICSQHKALISRIDATIDSSPPIQENNQPDTLQKTNSTNHHSYQIKKLSHLSIEN